MVRLSIEEIEELIRSCGLAPRKARAIWELSQIILQKHSGKVPNSFEALEALPGVGHKTASVVMSQAFGKESISCRHTHPSLWQTAGVLAMARRWKRRKLIKAFYFAKKYWNKLHLQIIYFAREYCPARNHRQEICPICSWAGTSTNTL